MKDKDLKFIIYFTGGQIQKTLMHFSNSFLDAEIRKENFLRLKQLILVGGPGDEIITPWQSAYVY